MKTFMKPLNAFIIVISMKSLFSCSNDDDVLILPAEPTTAELLANKWFLVKQIDNSTTPPTTYSADSCEQNTYFDFNDEGILIAETFSLNGAVCESQGLEALTYALNNNDDQLILTQGTTTQVADIVNLSKTELIITLAGGGSLEIHFSR